MFWRDLAKGMRTSIIAVPLQVGEIRRGVLLAQSTHQHYFAERGLLFLASVSRWVGTMVHGIELAQRNRAASIEQGRRMAAEELVTALAHDLRNYLVPILGRLDVMQRRAVREGQEQAVRDALELRKSADRLNHLVHHLIDLARIDRGLFDLSPERIDLSLLIREVAEGLSAPDAAIHVDVPLELPVVADPSRLRQALENLLANAIQLRRLPRSASVQAAMRPILSRRCRSSWLTGALESIRSSCRACSIVCAIGDVECLGIGLFLARQIAEAHVGRLEVSSSSTHGTEFRLTFFRATYRTPNEQVALRTRLSRDVT